jgi:hypothetical protein
LKKSALPHIVLVLAVLGFASCNGGVHINTPPSGVHQRVLASQSVSSPTAFGGLLIINGEIDALIRGEISAGSQPGLLAISPERSTLLSFDASSNKVDVVNTAKETLTGTIPLAGPTTSMVVPLPGLGFAAVPATPFVGSSPGAVVDMNLTSGGITATISVPNAQTVVSNSTGTQLLVFSNDSDAVTVVSPLLLNTGSPLTVAVPGFDRPVYGFFNGGNVYILNCGAECGGTQASVQVLNLGTTPPTAGPAVPVDGATIGFIAGATLYVAGNSPTNSACTGETTAATTCGRLDFVDLTSMAVTGSAVITDGYHNRIDMAVNGQLFVGSHGCTNIGNVNAPQGEVRGCLSIYNTQNTSVVIPPDNGDVTGLQSFTTRDVEYVVEGGNVRVYDTLIDSLLLDNVNDTNIPETGTVTVTGYVIDVKAVDFF